MAKIKKSVSILLAIIMILSVFTVIPFTVSAAEGDIYLGFTSDVHGKASGDTNYLGTWLDAVLGKYNLSYMSYCGDFGDHNKYGDAYVADFNNVVSVTNTKVGSGKGVYTSGNHDYQSDSTSTTPTATLSTALTGTAGFTRIGEAVKTSDYIIYCFGAASAENTFPQDDITAIDTYLGSAPKNIPIFVLSHYPIHYYKKNNYNVRTIGNASTLIDTLNKYPNVIFLWGHNHSMGDTHYGQVLKSGDTIQYDSSNSKEINFTYAAAGGMRNEASSGEVDYSGLVADISDNSGSKSVTFRYYQRSTGQQKGSDVTVQISSSSGDVYYKRVDALTADKDYVITAANSAGSAKAMKYNGASADGVEVNESEITVAIGDIDGDGNSDTYIKNPDDAVVWHANAYGSTAGQMTFTYGSDILECVVNTGSSSNDSFFPTVFTSSTNTGMYWYYEYSTSAPRLKLHANDTQNADLYHKNNETYDHNFKLKVGNTSSKNMYIYEKVESTVEPTTPEPTTITGGVDYQIADSFEDGEEYLIVSHDKDAALKAEAKDTTYLKAVAVTDNDGTITVSADDADSVTWTAAEVSGGYTLANGSKYLGYSSGYSSNISYSSTSKTWTYADNRLTSSSKYVYYSSGNGFKYGSTSTKAIYIYKKVFNGTTYKVTASVNGTGGSVSPKSSDVKEGKDLKLTITPDDNYELESLTDNGVDKTTEVSDGTYTIADIHETHTVTVTFKALPVTVYVPADTLEADGEYLIVNKNTAGDAYALKNSSSGNAQKVTIAADGTISVADTSKITWTADDSGYLKNGDTYLSRSTSFNSATLSFSTSSGKEWTYDSSSNYLQTGSSTTYRLYCNSSNTYALSTSTGDKYKTYLYVKDDPTAVKHTVTASVNGTGGSVSPASANVKDGQSYTLTITPGDNYVVSGIVDNGVEKTAGRTYTIDSVTEDHEISVSFRQVQADAGLPYRFDLVDYANGEGLVDGGKYLLVGPDSDKKNYYAAMNTKNSSYIKRSDALYTSTEASEPPAYIETSDDSIIWTAILNQTAAADNVEGYNLFNTSAAKYLEASKSGTSGAIDLVSTLAKPENYWTYVYTDSTDESAKAPFLEMAYDSSNTYVFYYSSSSTNDWFKVYAGNTFGRRLYLYKLATGTVTFKNGEDVLQSDEVTGNMYPVYGGATPTKAADEDHTYTFAGWSDGEHTYAANELPVVTGDVTYTAVFTPTDRICGHSISLNGDIAMNYYLSFTDEEVEDGVTVAFDWTVNNKDKNYTFNLKDDGIVTADGIKISCPVPIAEMTYDITVTITYNGGQSVKQEQYSVAYYANQLLTDNYKAKYLQKYPNGEAKYNQLAYLVKTMLNYGAKAQLHFVRNTDNLANAGITYTDPEINPDTAVNPDAINTEATAMTDNALSSYGLKYTGSTVVFLSKTSLRHYYEVIDQGKFDDYKGNITFNGSDVELKTRSDGKTYFEIENIEAGNLDKCYTLHIGNSDYKYSVLDYVKAILSSDKYVDGESTMRDLAKATYWYSVAAEAYFPQ